jgi:hypothetical protein
VTIRRENRAARRSPMAMTDEELREKTLVELREIAKTIVH